MQSSLEDAVTFLIFITFSPLRKNKLGTYLLDFLILKTSDSYADITHNLNIPTKLEFHHY